MGGDRVVRKKWGFKHSASHQIRHRIEPWSARSHREIGWLAGGTPETHGLDMISSVWMERRHELQERHQKENTDLVTPSTVWYSKWTYVLFMAPKKTEWWIGRVEGGAMAQRVDSSALVHGIRQARLCTHPYTANSCASYRWRVSRISQMHMLC